MLQIKLLDVIYVSNCIYFFSILVDLASSSTPKGAWLTTFQAET